MEIFIVMSDKKKLKENAFDMGIAGTTGAMDYAGGGWGTFASPDVRQNPASFVKSRSIGSNSNTATGTPATNTDNNAEINKIYNKEVTPSPDEVMTGLKYELQNMIKKDKGKAKEIVLNNLKRDPHYYGKLGMLNIDDKEMMNTDSKKQTAEEQMNERIKLLNQMAAARIKKAETPQSIKDALKETREKRDLRYRR
jgi:hypothetical protein